MAEGEQTHRKREYGHCEQDAVEGGCRQQGDILMTAEQGGEIGVLGRIQAKGGDGVGDQRDRRHGGHTGYGLLKQRRQGYGGDCQKDKTQRAQGFVDPEKLLDGQTPAYAAEKNQAGGRGIRGRKTVKGDNRVVVNSGKSDTQPQSKDDGQGKLYRKGVSPSALGGAEDGSHACTVLRGEQAGEQEQDGGVEQVIKAQGQQVIPARVVQEVGLLSLGAEGKDMVAAGLHLQQRLIPHLGVLQGVLILHVFLVADLRLEVLVLHGLFAVDDLVHHVPLLLDVGQLFVGGFSLQKGHVAAVAGIRGGEVGCHGTVCNFDLKEQHDKDENDVFSGPQKLVALISRTGADEAGDGGETELLAAEHTGQLFGQTKGGFPVGAVKKIHGNAAADGYEGEQSSDDTGERGDGKAKEIDGVVLPEQEIRVHDRKGVHETQGVIGIQIFGEVQDEIPRHQHKAAHVGKGMAPQEGGEHENEHTQGGHGKDLHKDGHHQQLAYFEHLGAVEVVLHELNVAAEGGEAVVAEAVEQERSTRKGDNGYRDGGQQGGEFSEDQGGMPFSGGMDEGENPTLFLVQDHARYQDQQKQE